MSDDHPRLALMSTGLLALGAGVSARYGAAARPVALLALLGALIGIALIVHDMWRASRKP